MSLLVFYRSLITLQVISKLISKLKSRTDPVRKKGLVMATIHPFLPGNCTFEPHDITAMSMALNDVCEALKINGDCAVRETVAQRIIELTKRGERSPTKLRDRVLWEANWGAVL